MTAGKPFGYKGEPGTCLYCGDQLRRETISATEADQDNPTYKVNEFTRSASIQAPGRAGRQDAQRLGTSPR